MAYQSIVQAFIDGRQARSQQEANQLALSQAKQKIADQNTLRDLANASVQREAYTDYPTMDGEKLPGLYTGNQSFDMNGYKNRLYGAGMVDQALSVEKAQGAVQKAQLDALRAQVGIQKDQVGMQKDQAQTGLYGVQTQEHQAKVQDALRTGRLQATRDALGLAQTGNVAAGLAHYNASVPEGERITGYQPMGKGLVLQFENGQKMQIPDIGQMVGKLDEVLTKPDTVYTQNRKAPEIQDVYQGNQIQQRQWDPSTRSFQVVGGGPRWNPNPSTVINNNMQSEKAFAVETAKQDAHYLNDLRSQAANAQDIAQRVQAIQGAVNAGVFTGSWASRSTDAANFLNTLGLPIQADKLANSQEFNAQVGELILSRVKQLGSNPSNSDREFVERTVPNLTQSPQARQALLDYMQNQAKRTMDTYQSADQYGRAHNGLGGWQTPSPPPQKPQGNVQAKTVTVQGRKLPARLAPDGHYYVQQNGQYYRVE